VDSVERRINPHMLGSFAEFLAFLAQGTGAVDQNQQNGREQNNNGQN